MNRFSAIDEPVQLGELIEQEQLQDVLGSIARLHPVAVEIRSPKGELLCSTGELLDEPCSKHHIEYSGDVIGTVHLTPKSGELSVEGDSIAAHIAAMLTTLVHSAYARHLTSTIHKAAMEESFAELNDRNKRLASAIERLEEVERLKSNFLATISHELRTPLTSIIGYSEMLSEGLAGELNKEQKEYMQTILGKADHLLQLITGILDVSLIEARSLRLAIKPVDVAELIEGVASTMARDLEQRKIVLELDAEGAPHALGDARKLRQVVLHLLANAIKFSPDGGDVKISLDVGALSPGDSSTPTSPFWQDKLSERFGLRVRVTDQGIGIPDEKRGSIFEPFFQVDSSSTRAFGGTGLGLSLARSYVVAHGGFLWVEDAVPGPGSIFTFTLPAVESELAAYVSKRAEL